jgi:uncharacterized iron-regulated membrane protein
MLEGPLIPMSKPAALKRKIFLTVHQWLGLGSSLIVLVLCLTGTLLALQGPIESWINRDVQRVVPQGQPMALETLVPKLAAEAERPFTGLVIPPSADEALQLRQGRAVTYVNPYTGEVLGEVNAGVRDAFMVVFRLHRWLLLDDGIGRPITGAATVIFVVTLLTGMLLWWPKHVKQLLGSLRFRKNANWKGWNYDLHVVLGLYALVPLFVMGVSGLYWSYNAPFKAAVYRVFDGQPAPEAKARPRAAGDAPTWTALPYARLVEKTNQVYPYAGPIRITFPRAANQPVEVSKVHMPTAISMPYVDQLTLDGRTGEVLEQAPFAQKTRAERVLSLIKDIHVGTVFGGASLAIYLLACAIGTTLPLTGALHWWSKLRARRRAELRIAQAPAKAGTETEAFSEHV